VTSTPTNTITITIRLLGHGLYNAYAPDGTELVQRSREPLLAAARALTATGVKPDARLQMQREGSNSVDAWGRLGTLAGLTVAEGQRQSPAFVRYQPPPSEAALRPVTAHRVAAE
jgi:hypothetical protein